ncbi:MAG TPA: VIT and VWA domain-containing protein, partial [Agitococcus sp.]|nr:VIT and VWA domain-containing protein [Agitococcus sp.]
MRALLQKTMLGVAISSSLAMSQSTWAAGMLQVAGDKNQAIRIIDHDVAVTINNGFAKVEVTQRFANPNSDTVEAVYNFPLPKSASLSEMSILSGETRLNGEVLAKKQAETIYQEQKSQGKEAGLAKQNSYKSLDFKVYPLMPKQDVTVRFVYYQPVVLDTGVGRFVYPLSEGGTDEAGQQFWAKNEQVDNSFSIDINVKSAWPIDSVRAPNLEQVAQISHKNAYQWQLKAEQMGKSLNQDVVFYYRLADNLPGRVEVIPYKAAKDKEGTFMLVVTPGVDLKPLNAGADYTFVLDVSGSMDTKLATLIKGIEQTLGKMTGNDRFRVVAFNDTAKQVIPMTLATPDNVQQAIEQLKNLRSNGGTNLYAAVREGLNQLDADRVNNMIL